MKPEDIMRLSPVIAVVTIENAAQAGLMARALLAGGVRAIEVTLRTPAALDAIRCIAREAPDAVVGAGTVLTPEDLDQVTRAGARFALSPGATPDLLAAARKSAIAFIPGVATSSEIMRGLAHDFTHFKFYPAESIGGPTILQTLAGPFPNARFCAAGGIEPDRAKAYLTLANVACIGASWVAPTDKIASGDWTSIESLAAKASSFRKTENPAPERALAGANNGASS